MCERTWPLGAPLDEGACEQQAIQRPQEKIILLGGRDGLRRLAQIRTYAIYQRDEYSFRTWNFSVIAHPDGCRAGTGNGAPIKVSSNWARK
jgi:hypothetical protein